MNAARLSALCGMLGLLAFTLITIGDVLMRWLFNSPIAAVSDVAPLIVAIVVAAFFPLALAERHNVSIEFLGGLLGPRSRLWLNVFAATVSLLFFVLLVWQFIAFTIDLREIGQTTWVIQLPVAPWWAITCAFLLLCVFVQLIVLWIDSARAVAGKIEEGKSAETQKRSKEA